VSSRPRIALVAASLDILGGQGVQARLLQQRLEGEGYPVRFLPINPRFPARLRWLRRVPYARTLANQALYLPSLKALGGCDVAHVFSASYWSFLLAPAPALSAAQRLGRRVVLHYHSGEAEDHLARWGALVHPWLRRAHTIVVPSDYLRRVFARHGYPTCVVRNVVETTAFRWRERRPLRPRLLSVRNLEPHYRVDDVLRAYAIVKARRPDASLGVAGYGSQLEPLRRLAACLELQDVEFLGRVEPEDMPALYDAADVFLNASVVDNQPVSILEAFAAGLPVVSTPTGDIAAMVRHGESGLLVPAREPAAMAQAVLRLLADPLLACEVASRAREESERSSWSRVRREWEAVYARTLNGGIA
jgi:glycosyltransferase involved in cell wall biosynthesis